MIGPQQAWDWLARELDRWGESGQSASFWWRDDDATEPSAELERLLQTSLHHDLPLALAVIPAQLDPRLVTHLQQFPRTSVLQHGFNHRSHALPGQRKLELGGDRDADAILGELAQGYRILQQQFADRFVPVMVPPWNRIDANLLARLSDIGLCGLSTMRVRRLAHPAPGLLQVNTHLDPINWRMHRDAVRRRHYEYWVVDPQTGEWVQRQFKLRYRFAPGALRRRQVNLYFAAALLQIYGRQCPEIDGAFGSVAHRDPVSHFIWGDRVDTAAHEDSVLRARRRLIDYYAERPPGSCGMFGELELASPMEGAPLKVLSGWGEWRGRRGYRRHKGVDIFSPVGAPVYAIGDGEVMFAGVSVRRRRRGRVRSQAMPFDKARRVGRRRLSGGGMFVMVRHDGNELISAYMHLSGYAVEKGQRVERGHLLGYTGGTGVSISKPHLHFELRRPPREHFDPMLALRKCLIAPEATYIGRWRLQRDGVRTARVPEDNAFIDADGADVEPLP